MDMIFAWYNSRAKPLLTGLLIAVLIALAAKFISEHYGAPAMLMALLFGIALNFLSKEGPAKEGIAFASSFVLRAGVALLGARVSVDMAASLGWATVLMVMGSVLATILFGLAIGRFLGHGPRFAFLSAGSVAICGASAAIAISAILPRDERTQERLIFTVAGVTVLSTIAMIIYPIFATMLGLSEDQAGVFLGSTIHDVAQVVGAGFSVSESTGETATVVKLIRVSMLAPVIFCAVLVIRWLNLSTGDQTGRPPLVPWFVAGFVLLAAVNSMGWLPILVADALTEASRWALLTAIAAVGVRTSLEEVFQVGGRAIALLVLETLFLALLVVAMLTTVLAPG
ncbi:MAG: putative sulfate exporter family transporter [Pseudomonadota bacterium]